LKRGDQDIIFCPKQEEHILCTVLIQMVSCNATPVILNEWFAAFGLGDNNTKQSCDDENRTADVSYDTVYFHNDPSPLDHAESSKPPRSVTGSTNSNVPFACDPTKCRMLNGICCDCCKCLNHCKCGDLKILPPTCDTPDCSDRVCTQCMRCHHHCLCRCSTVRSEHDKCYLASVHSPTSVVSKEQTDDALLTGTSSDRVAPPTVTDERYGTAEEDSVWRNCYDPYEQGDDDDDDVDDYEMDYNGSKDWTKKYNTRIVTSQGTVASTATAKTNSTWRQNKTNVEVLYDQKYTPPYRTNSTSSYCSLTLLNCLHQPKRIHQQRHSNVNMRLKSRLKSRQIARRPKGVAALAEF
jgi:hypothetical protein